MKSLPAALFARRSRPRTNGPAMQRGVREGCIASLRAVLKGPFQGGRAALLRQLRGMAPFVRGDAGQGAPTTVFGA
jgi:hypothetical protein